MFVLRVEAIVLVVSAALAYVVMDQKSGLCPEECMVKENSWLETDWGIKTDWEGVLVRRTECCQHTSILTAVKMAARLEMAFKSIYLVSSVSQNSSFFSYFCSDLVL